VDALLGVQRRPHKDLDIAIEENDLSGLTAALEARGYREVLRHSQWNFVPSDDRGHQVDVHSRPRSAMRFAGVDGEIP